MALEPEPFVRRDEHRNAVTNGLGKAVPMHGRGDAEEGKLVPHRFHELREEEVLARPENKGDVEHGAMLEEARRSTTPLGFLRVSVDLTGQVNGTPERFVPEQMKGELAEAEHLCRYWWAAELAAGRRVLDAGCGIGYGAALMAEAGAAEVVGVDISETVVEAARARVPEGVTLTTSDVASLPFGDGAFGLVVCFEVIEHVEDALRVLDELRRVVATDGLLVVSSPNRGTYVPGNPHHVHEFEPEELRAALAERFADVALYRQHDFAASVVLSDEDLPGVGPRSLTPAIAGKTATHRAGEETYTVALASSVALPSVGAGMCLTSPLEVRRWVEHFDAQQHILRDQAESLHELRLVQEERQELATQLAESELGLATVAQLEHALRQAQHDRDELRAQLDATSEIIRSMASSVSWRLTAPLRVAKRVGSNPR